MTPAECELSMPGSTLIGWLSCVSCFVAGVLLGKMCATAGCTCLGQLGCALDKVAAGYHAWVVLSAAAGL